MRQIQCFAISSLDTATLRKAVLRASALTAFTSALIIATANAALVTQTQNIELASDNWQEIKSNRSAIAQRDVSAIDQSALEQAVLEEVNRARTNPEAYADWLEEMKQYYEDNGFKLPGQSPIRISEGVEAVDKAIEFLRDARPLPALSLSRGMAMAARDYVKEQEASDSSQLADRLNRYGSASDPLGENISYGSNTAQGVVIQLIVNDRENIFNPDFQVTGIACGPHGSSESICAIAYAGKYQETVAQEPDSENPVTRPQPSISEESLASTSSSEAATPLLFKRGILEEGDSVIPADGSLYDSYPLLGRAGQSLTIALESEDFDAYLAIQDPQGKIIGESDDTDQSDTNPTLTITLPSDGLYRVIVNAYDAKGRGQYTLTVR